MRMSNSELIREEAPATAANRAQRLLLDFLRDHDALCPLCGYNLKGLIRPVYPECQQDLALSVSTPHITLGWLILALAPGFFCGVAACLLAIPTTAIYFEDGAFVWPFVFAVLFGWCSGIFAIVLAFGRRGCNRNRFIALPRRRQMMFVAIIYGIHIVLGMAFFAWLASEI